LSQLFYNTQLEALVSSSTRSYNDIIGVISANCLTSFDDYAHFHQCFPTLLNNILTIMHMQCIYSIRINIYFKGIEISFFYVDLNRNLFVMHPPRILNLY